MSAYPSIFDTFFKAADDLCRDFDRALLAPLLEADIVGYLYHRLLLANIVMQDIHLDTRVVGVPKFKYDLVIGPVTLGSQAQKAAVSDPQLIAQIKFFPRWGFDSHQDREHYVKVTNDLVSFEPLQAAFPSCKCCELLVDFHYSRDLQGYLNGRDESAKSSKIEWICRLAKGVKVVVGWLNPEDKNKTIAKWWLLE